ncbi:hypothetical protein MKW92_024878 [Papaver armeniacum]|nr:hypothetical protein MKW92_024878 [Papaver armeniacum]
MEVNQDYKVTSSSHRWRIDNFSKLKEKVHITSPTITIEGQMIQFSEFKNYGGFDNIIQLKELNDPSNGYIVDDVCIIEVKICSNSAQESKEKTRKMLCLGHSRMMFPREETKNPMKLREDDPSAVQRSNWDINESHHSNSRMDDQSMPTPVNTAVNVTPKTLKDTDGYRKYSIAEIKGPWVTGWLSSDARTIFDAYPPYEPWTLNMVASDEVTSIPHDTDGSDGDSDSDGDDDPDFTPVIARQKRKPSAGGQTVKDASAKRSRPHRLDVRYSGENTEAVEIPNVDSVDACPASTPVGANIASELQTEVTDAGQTSASVPAAVPSNIIASHPLSSSSGVEQTESHMFGNPFVAPEESADYDVLMQSAMLDYKSTLSSLARFGEYCQTSHKLNLFYHTKSKDLATRLSDTQREKSICLRRRCRDWPLVRTKQTLHWLNKSKPLMVSVQEKLTVANARIQEVESLNEAQFQQHADVKLQLEGNVKHIIYRTLKFYSSNFDLCGR